MEQDLTKKRCLPCEGGVPPLEPSAIEAYLKKLPSWSLEGKTIVKEFGFADFKAALSFVNQVGELAEGEGHHPDIHIHYNKVRLEIWTHVASPRGGWHLNEM